MNGQMRNSLNVEWLAGPFTQRQLFPTGGRFPVQCRNAFKAGDDVSVGVRPTIRTAAWRVRVPLLLLFLFCCCSADTVSGQDASNVELSVDQVHGLQHIPDTIWSPGLSMLGMQAMIAAWLFVLGACFGSSLNVVIYRLPAGMSLGKPKSRCPRCETPLSARDNIPVLGWMMLRGKCRYCSLPIAGRYPLIEATCGAVVLALLFGELLTGAANLPLRHPDHFHVNPGFWLAECWLDF